MGVDWNIPVTRWKQSVFSAQVRRKRKTKQLVNTHICVARHFARYFEVYHRIIRHDIGPKNPILFKKWQHMQSINFCTTGGTSSKEPACQCRRLRRSKFDPWVRKIPWRRAWQPNPVFLPGESNWQRSLVGYSPRGCKELDMTEQLNNSTSLAARPQI